jgi:3-keto-5-aminohexanoate cleavage enzyme
VDRIYGTVMVYAGYSDYFEQKLIVQVATTGGIQGKEANPNLPEQPGEIVDDIVACEKAGASIVHLHTRDETGEETKDPERIQELRDRIDDRCDNIIVNYTTGGLGFTREERFQPHEEVEPPPELASLDLGPMCHGQEVQSSHPREEVEGFAERMGELGIKPELEVFHPGLFTEVYNLIEKDLIEKPYYCNLILGMQTGTVPNPRNLLNMVDNLPDATVWTCMATGRHQLPLTTLGILLGGHVRVGMEDNIYYRKGELVQSNAQLVERTVGIAEDLNREIATPNEARSILGI